MPQSLANVLVHIVFSTKDRQPLISSEVIPDLHRYIGGTCAGLNCTPHQVGGIENHVHIACNLHRVQPVSDLIKQVKVASTKWMKEQGVRNFQWQGGYSVFSFAESQKSRVVEYIANQREHHAKRTYQEEVIAFLEEYRLAYDERYLWD